MYVAHFSCECKQSQWGFNIPFYFRRARGKESDETESANNCHTICNHFIISLQPKNFCCKKKHPNNIRIFSCTPKECLIACTISKTYSIQSIQRKRKIMMMIPFLLHFGGQLYFIRHENVARVSEHLQVISFIETCTAHLTRAHHYGAAY